MYMCVYVCMYVCMYVYIYIYIYIYIMYRKPGTRTASGASWPPPPWAPPILSLLLHVLFF